MKIRSTQMHPDGDIDEILEQVPPDYYQTGVKTNILQRFWHKSRLQETKTLLKNTLYNNHSGLRVLDIGCASGWFLSELAKELPSFHCTGVDLYKDAIAFGKKKYPHIEFRVADAHALPMKNNSYDVVLCMNLLEHVVAPEGIVQEIKRVLKPNGIAIIGIDNETFLFHIGWTAWTKLSGKVWKHAHLHKFNVGQLSNSFIKQGFNVKKIKFFNMSLAIVFLLENKI